MTFLKRNILIFTLLVIIVITLSSCEIIKSFGNDDSPQEENSILVDNTSSSEKDKETPNEEKNSTDDSENLIEATIGSATFLYNEKYEVLESEGIKYIYFNEKDFFITESSGKVYDEEKMTKENAKQVFDAIEESYNQGSGSWSNGKQVGSIEETTIDGYNAWSTGFSMEYTGGIKYTSKVVLTYINGEILIFSVLSQVESAKNSEAIFEKIMSTVKVI